MVKTKRDFYFFGFGNMAQAIYQRMNKKFYQNIYIIEKSKKITEKLANTREVENESESFTLSPETIVVQDQEYFYVSNFDIFLLWIV